MIFLDYQDPRPIYEQIVDKFEHLILKGVFEDNEQLPSVRKLAMELSTNPNTIQKAYGKLEQDGFIYSIKGRGNFVHYNKELKKDRLSEIVSSIETLLDEASELGVNEDMIFNKIMKHRGKDVRKWLKLEIYTNLLMI